MKKETIVSKISSVINFLNPLVRKEAETSAKVEKATIREQNHNDITWIDIINPTRKDLNELTEKYPFDSLHLQACLSKGQLDRLEVEEKYLFILLHPPKYSKKANKINTTRICFFVGKKYLITVHKGSHEAFTTLFDQVEAEEELREKMFKKSSGYLLYEMLNVIGKDMAELHDTVLKEVDEVEDLVFDVNLSGAYEITELRQKIIRLKRVTTPFRNITQELAADTSEFTESLTRYFKYLTNEVNKLRELLDEAKEVIEIYKDADFTVSTERTNKILGILTIIFTLAIPAQIVGSFYGMNILLPGGSEAGPLMFWGPFTTFYLIVGLAVGSILLMLWLFKHKKWF